MTKRNSTKKALLASVLSLALCFTMLIGSTFAWFTDSATTGVNKIVSGNLDVELSYKNDGMTDYATVTNTTNVFKDGGLWEPGYVEYVYFKVENLGTLALKYQLSVAIANEIKGTNVAGEELMLSKYIKFAAIDGEQAYTSSAEAIKAAEAANPTSLSDTDYTLEKGITAGGDAQLVTMIVYMPTTVGNEANYKTGTTKPEIDLGINLVATQDTVENDSFGNTYDKTALFGNEILVNNDAELAAILSDLSGIDTVYLAAGEFSAFNMFGKSVDLIGATNPDGTPATTIKATTALTNVDFHDPGAWGKYTGNVKNIRFEAADGVANASPYDYDAFVLNDNPVATFENCHFINQGIKFLNGDVDFINCVFDGKNHAKKAINYSVASGEILFDGCTIKNYEESTINIGESDNGSIVIKNCEIYSSAIELGALKALTIENSTLNCNVIIWINTTVVTIPDGSFGEGFDLTIH